MNPRNILWPTDAKTNPTGVQRLVRVLHWTFAAAAVAALSSALFSPIGDAPPWIGFAAGLALFGRALRYIMAAE